MCQKVPKINEKDGLSNPTQSLSNRQRFTYIEERQNEVVRKIERLQDEVTEIKCSLAEMRQSLKDCQNAERERNDNAKDSKNDHKWLIGVAMAIISIIVGFYPR